MRDKKDCKYFNDIKGCEVKAVYESGDFIEIQYLKEGIKKSLTIEYCRYAGGMGYGSFFRFGGVELAQWMIRYQRTWVKSISEKLNNIKTIVEINSYFKSNYGHGDSEELGIVYQDENAEVHTYLLGFGDDEGEFMDATCKKDDKPTFEKEECGDETMPKELFSVNAYKEVLAFALKAHKEQKTPEGLPYSFHIVSVAMEVINSLSMHHISYDEANVAIACALLHDVEEDTDTGIGTNSLNIANIETVLQGVWALTKDENLPTKQDQMQESLKRLKEQPKCVQMVKLADRITNLAPAPDFWNRAKRQAYLDEAKQILEALKDSNTYLASKLQSKIDNYAVNGDDNFVVFYAQNTVIVLDKSHPKYLKTFKAINRLNSYLMKRYELKFFDKYSNIQNIDEVSGNEKVAVNYMIEIMNTQNLLYLNVQTDSTVDKYFTAILDGEDCIDR